MRTASSSVTPCPAPRPSGFFLNNIALKDTHSGLSPGGAMFPLVAGLQGVALCLAMQLRGVSAQPARPGVAR